MGKSWVDSQLRFPRGKIETRVRKFPPADDGVVRVRVGGLPETSGYYCDYRGTRQQAITALEHAIEALRELKAEAQEERTS